MAPRRQKHRVDTLESLRGELTALPDLPLGALKERWQTFYGSPPPARLRRAVMLRAIAHRMQEQVYGELTPITRRRLTRIAEDLKAGRPAEAPQTSIKPGTRLLREWQGVTHEVVVLEKGIQYRGNTWPSLSAVAREITGTRWSGPLFFGLKGRRNGRT